MLEYMENVSQNEAENIRKTIQDLFRQTCILQTKCDPVTLIQKDNPHYQVCARNQEFISDYLQVLDCELIHDPQEHIFRIAGDGVLTERMTLLTTKLVILMKLIYRDKIMGEGLHATTTSLAEIRRYGKETNLITRRLTAQEWQEALILMKTHQMIELPGAIGNLEDDSPIYIYSTINIFCSAADINALVERYKGESTEPEDIEEELQKETESLKEESSKKEEQRESEEAENTEEWPGSEEPEKDEERQESEDPERIEEQQKSKEAENTEEWPESEDPEKDEERQESKDPENTEEPQETTDEMRSE